MAAWQARRPGWACAGHPVLLFKGEFKGILFTEFPSQVSRDTAVDLLRRASFKSGEKNVWATQDSPPADRAARNFCLGSKRVLKDEWEMPYKASVDGGGDSPYIVTVGGEHALTARVDGVDGINVFYDWQGAWATWDTLHNNSRIKELNEKSRELLARASQGMKGGNAGKGMHKGARKCQGK